MSSLAARTRETVRSRPFLYDALGAGIVNYTAAARSLDVDGETEAIATALRRYADELSDTDSVDSGARVTMESGIGNVEEGTEPLLTVGETAYDSGSGSETGILVTGSVDALTLERALGALRTESIPVGAAGLAEDTIVLVVGRRDGPDALRAVEGAIAA